MIRLLAIIFLILATLVPEGAEAQVTPAVYYPTAGQPVLTPVVARRRVYYGRRHRRHAVRRTVKRVGIGAAGGAAIGAIAGGGPGAAIGAIAGAGAGAVYDAHERHQGR